MHEILLHWINAHILDVICSTLLQRTGQRRQTYFNQSPAQFYVWHNWYYDSANHRIVLSVPVGARNKVYLVNRSEPPESGYLSWPTHCVPIPALAHRSRRQHYVGWRRPSPWTIVVWSFWKTPWCLKLIQWQRRGMILFGEWLDLMAGWFT